MQDDEDSWPAALRWWLTVPFRGDGTTLRLRVFDLLVRALFWWTGMHVRGNFSRSLFEAVTSLQNVPAGRGRAFTSRDATAQCGVPYRWFEPTKRTSDLLLIYMHGGGFGINSERSGLWAQLVGALVQRLGCRAASVGYRLAPEHPYPAALHDVCAVIRELGAAERVVFAGDSAGGNLALVSALCAKLGEPGTPLHVPTPAHLLLIYPALFDEPERHASDPEQLHYLLPRGTRSFWRRSYLGDGAAARERLADWRVAPLRAPSLEGLPPTTVISASLDPLCASNLCLVRALQSAGVATVHIHEAGPHGFLTLPPLLGYDGAARRVLDVAAAAVPRTCACT